MFNRFVKRDGMKIIASEFQFSRSLRIVRELDVNDVDVLIIYSRSTCRNKVLFIAENMLRVRLD